MRSTLMAGASSFAHLLGRGAARAEDKPDDKDDDKQRDGESDEDYAKRMEEKDEKKESARKKAEKEEQDRKNEEASRADNGSGDDEEGDDGSDDEDMRNKVTRSARMRERARIATIFSASGADANLKQAMVIALTTNLPRSHGVKLLNASAPAPVASAPRRPSLDERMAAVKTPVAGAGDPGRAGGGGTLSAPQKTALHSQLVMARLRQAPTAEIDAIEAKLRAA